MTVVCDSGVIFAALDRRDRSHEKCVALLSSVDGVIAPALILVEVDWLSSSRGVHGAMASLLNAVVERVVHLVDLDLDGYTRARDLMERYARLGLSLVDASVIAVAERLEVATIGTLDRRGFSVVRPAHVPAFTLVP